MNAFELRQRRRRQVRELTKSKTEFTQVLEVVGVQRFYEDAHLALYNQMPALLYRNGWFFLNCKRICRAELMRRAMKLYALLKESEDESDSRNSTG